MVNGFCILTQPEFTVQFEGDALSRSALNCPCLLDLGDNTHGHRPCALADIIITASHISRRGLNKLAIGLRRDSNGLCFCPVFSTARRCLGMRAYGSKATMVIPYTFNEVHSIKRGLEMSACYWPAGRRR